MTTFDKVKEIVADKLGVDKAKVTEASSFVTDLGADSLDVVEFVMEVEKEFKITIPDEEADPMIEELLEAVEKLPSDEKAIIDLYYLDNFEKRSQREIADEIGVSQQVFSYRLKQILKKMKGLFCEN